MMVKLPDRCEESKIFTVLYNKIEVISGELMELLINTNNSMATLQGAGIPGFQTQL